MHGRVNSNDKCKRASVRDYQLEAIQKMKNGCILCGGVGTGKSRTALGYFYTQYGGRLNTRYYVEMKNPPDLYIITTARKRDSLEWEGELLIYMMNVDSTLSLYPTQKVVIDSWNNIKKYEKVKNSFFIFDEQRVIGSGAWTKTFIKITKSNKWILLSATPGDTWTDYIPVFIANGFYKNRTEFLAEHAVYSRFTKFPKIDKFVGTKKLEAYRRSLLVDMTYKRETVRNYKNVLCEYDKIQYKTVNRDRWDVFNEKPIENPAALCYLLRKVVNSDSSRKYALMELLERHNKLIVFYNFDYELDILHNLYYGPDVKLAEWNGHKHEPVPKGNRWVYLVQYSSGSEAWNCIETDTIVFYSQNYSYKIMEQAAGRIDRLNTPYKNLYYYTLKSRAPIDVAISVAIKEKKIFNERGFIKCL